MATFTPEDHLDSLVAYMRASLQPFMDAESARHADGLSLGTLLVGNVIPGGMWPIPTLAPDQPAIEVAIPDEGLQNFSIGGTDADETLTVAIRAWQQWYGDPVTVVEETYRKTLRIGAALAKALYPSAFDAFGNGAVVQQARSSWRVDPTTDQRESYTSSLVLVLQLATDATFI